MTRHQTCPPMWHYLRFMLEISIFVTGFCQSQPFSDLWARCRPQSLNHMYELWIYWDCCVLVITKTISYKFMHVSKPMRSITNWRRALVFFLICAGRNGWTNNSYAVYLRRHCTHYDITVMKKWCYSSVAIMQPTIQHTRFILVQHLVRAPTFQCNFKFH